MAAEESTMNIRLLKLAGASALAIALLAACGGETPVPEIPEPVVVAEPAPPMTPDYASLITAPGRIDGDAAKDGSRKPAEVLAFAKVMPGNTILELEAGAGYYTELLSRAVGTTGKVIMQAPKEFESFYKDALAARTKDARLANVTVSWSPFDKLEAADASVDVVTWFQGPHELWCKAACGNAPMGAPAAAFSEIARVLKPGGYLVVMDHVATAGAPETMGNDLHRIDAAIVKPMIEAAGFTQEEESQLLANPADDHTKGVFDPSIQGKTDQWLIRYKKN
jgi:predicted methyltransferase